MKIRIEIVAAAILILIVTFGIGKCQADRTYRNQLAQIDSLTLANQTLTTKLNKAGQTINMQTAIVTDNQRTIKDLTDSIFNLKKRDARKVKEVIAYWREHTSTHIDSVKVPYTDSVQFQKFADSVQLKCADVINYMYNNTITVPRTSKGDSAYYSYDLTVDRSGVTINKMEFPDSLDMRFVEKGGFLKKRSIEVQFKHTNPHVKVQGSSSVLYKPKPKGRWVERAIVLAVGIFVGLKL